MSIVLRGLLSAALVTFAAPVAASPIQAMKDYNLIVFSDTTLQSNVEGAVYVDGNYNAGSVQVASKGTNAQGASLVVTGNVANNPKVKTSDAYIGGKVSSKLDFQGGGGQQKALSDLPGGLLAQSDFLQLSSDLSMLKPGVSYDRYSPGDHRNGFVIAPGVPNDDGTAVIFLAEDFFPNTGKIRFESGADKLDTIIINVAGTTVNIRGWEAAGNKLADTIIWNFYEATKVTFNEQNWGSVLAPGALVSANSQLWGSVVAGASGIRASVRAPLYDGSFAFPDAPVAPVAEPAAFGFLAAGLGLLMWRRHGRTARRG